MSMSDAGGFLEMRLKEFLAELGSSSPAPGGGSAAALAGAVGASLIQMVANLTIGKEKFKQNEERMREILADARSLADTLADLMDRDTAAFDRVMEAYRLPKTTPEEKEGRKAAIQNALKEACSVPLEVMRLGARALPHAREAASLGNPNALSDAGVSGLMLRAAVEGAWYNVLINVQGIEDEEYRRTVSDEAARIRDEAEKAWRSLEQVVTSGLFRS